MSDNEEIQTRKIGSVPATAWQVSAKTVDLSASPHARPAGLAAEPQDIIYDKSRTALIVIDMQNFFCAPEEGNPDKASRKPIEPLKALLPAVRDEQMPVIWVNWGTRPDRLNLSPSVQYTFKADPKEGPGESGAARLFKGSEAAEIIPELRVEDTDVLVDKHRLSGFWDTPLDSILRNMGIRTLMFAGVNLDQCVLCTLQDASFLGYDSILLTDCAATGSPQFCIEASYYNIKRCFGFLSTSRDVMDGLGIEGGLV